MSPARPEVARARAAVFVYFSIMGTGIGFWAAQVPAVQQRTGVDAGTMAMALFLIAAGAVVVTPAISWIARRQGSRRWTTLGAAAFSLAVSLPLLAATPEALMAGAFCLGLAIGATDVPLNVHAVEVEKAWGRPTMSAFHGFYSLGGAAGATAGGLAVGTGSWLPAAAMSLLLAGGAAAANGFLLRGEAQRRAEERPPWRLSRTALALGLLAALCFGIEGAVVDWSALYLAGAKGLALPAAASGPAVFMLTMALARFAGDAVVARFGRPATLALSGAGIAAGAAVAVLAQGIVSAAGFGLVGAAAANIIPILFSEAGRARDIAPEAAIAAMAAIGYAGFLLSPPLVGALAQASSLSAAFALAGAGGLVFVSAGLRRARR